MITQYSKTGMNCVIIPFIFLIMLVGKNPHVSGQRLLLQNPDITPGQVKISYELVGRNAALYDIKLSCYKGKDQYIETDFLKGDLINVSASKNLAVLWDVYSQNIKLNNSFKFEISAYEKKRLDMRRALLKSTVLPGWGQKNVGGKPGTVALGVIAYGALGSAAYCYSESQHYYSLYKNEYNDNQNQDKLYNSASDYKKIFYASIATAATIWIIDYIVLLKKANNIKKKDPPINGIYYFPERKPSCKASKEFFVDTRSDFDKLIQEADIQYSKKDYEGALETYQRAKIIQPDNQYATDKIRELQIFFAENEFNKIVKDADFLFSNKDFSTALKKYRTADSMISNNQHVIDQIGKIITIFSDIEFNEMVKNADALLSQKDYESAMEKYKTARSLRPDYQYVIDKISEIEHLSRSELESKALDFYKKEIEQEIESAGYLRPKGDFETQDAYNKRLDRAVEFRKQLNSKYIDKYKQRLK